MSHAEAQEELLSPAEVAALLYVDPETVTRWAAAGKLAAVRTPSGHRRYLRSEVLAIVSGLHPDRRARPPREVVQAPDRPIGQPLTIVPSPRAGDGVEVASERQVAAAAVVGAAVSLALETAALAVALETDAHAAGIALVAGEAAVALLTDELWARTVDLKADLGEHALATVVREVRASDRAREMAEILAAAAAMDRIYAMTDPAASTSDRAKISVHPSSESEAWGLGGGGSISEAAAELSHDLRVPLSSIIASVEMLEDELRDHAGGSIPALLGRATRAGDRMVRMLDQNMTLGAEGSSPPRSEVDLNEVVRHLVLDSANLLEPLGAVVEAGTLPVVRADPDGMYSVLQNLLGNAVKFARPGVPARVRVSARRSVQPGAKVWFEMPEDETVR